MKKIGFTLAEVLITLGIIGIVAAMTIPNLVMDYNKKSWDSTSDVFQKKLETALKAMNAQSTLAGHETTENFVEELSKHFKINKICKTDELMDCFENSVVWGNGEQTPEEIDLTDIKDSKHFGQDGYMSELIGTQFANGTTALIAYNKPGCEQDPYSNQINGLKCLAILYDTSGEKNPNTSGKDLRAINVASLQEGCTFKVNETCYGFHFIPTPVTKAECEEMKASGKYGINSCYYDDDYWVGAVKACGGESNMPTEAQLTDIAKYIYEIDSITTGRTTGINYNPDKVSQMGFTNGIAFWLWSNNGYSSQAAKARYFGPRETVTDGVFRYASSYMALCINND